MGPTQLCNPSKEHKQGQQEATSQTQKSSTAVKQVLAKAKHVFPTFLYSVSKQCREFDLLRRASVYAFDCTFALSQLYALS